MVAIAIQVEVFGFCGWEEWEGFVSSQATCFLRRIYSNWQAVYFMHIGIVLLNFMQPASRQVVSQPSTSDIPQFVRILRT